ncbi:MAG TPA: histidine kinase [Casimicrobiaceae bacterium]|nr:histidine kinase [Casimicrobiaceae bacterium]
MTAPTLPAAAPPEGLSLLVVEASADDFERIAARLRSTYARLRCIRVETREALAAALHDGGWSAVLCDSDVPGCPAADALSIVRARSPELPVVLLGRAIGDEDAAAALQSGAADCVTKDDPGRLVPALARALDAAQAQARRKAAEAALVESEARFRSLAANLPGMVFQLEADGGRLAAIYASEGARRLFGLAAEELARDPGAWLQRLRPEDAKALGTRLLVATAGVTAHDWTSPGQHPVPGHWIELEAQAPRWEDPAADARHVEITARARRMGPTRVLWDGIATDISRQKGAEAELHRSRAEVRELATHLETVREHERAAIARELHDDVGSTLTGVKFQLAVLKARVAAQPDVAAQLAALDQLVDGAITASTRIMRDLRPPILDAGIVAALEWQARSFEHRTGIACAFNASADQIDLPADHAIVVFRVCQEALTNVIKHAQARRVEIALSVSDGELALEIDDDGRGIGPGDDAKRGHFGLRGMHERAFALDGAVAVRPRDDGPGTSVSLVIPCAFPEGTSDTEPSTA